MALKHFTFVTSTTPQKVLTLPQAASVRCYFQNTDATNDIYIGTSAVTASGSTQGLKIIHGSNPIELFLDGGDTIWAVSGALTPALTIIWTAN